MKTLPLNLLFIYKILIGHSLYISTSTENERMILIIEFYFFNAYNVISSVSNVD